MDEVSISLPTEAAPSPAELPAGASSLGSPATAAAWAVTKWVGSNIASGIVGSIGGEIFSSVMKAIGMGGPDLVEKLDKISDQHKDVQRSIDRLTEMTTEVLKQLNALRDFMEKSLKIETLLAAMNRIAVAYGDPSSSETLLQSDSTGEAISLYVLTQKMPHFEGITPAALEKAAKSFADYVIDVPDCIRTIRRVLAKGELGQSSLLILWAKELGQQVRDKKISRPDAGLVLEGYFLYAISMQLKGVCVHGVALGTRELGPQFIKQYLEDDFAAAIREEVSAYLEAVEYLIFSSLDPIMLTGVKDAMDEREFPRHVDEMLLRANLVCAALRLVGNKGLPDGSPHPSTQAAIQGIYGTSLFRPSDLKDAKAPAVNPAGYPPVAGTEQRELTMFPVLDLHAEGDMAKLRNLSKSFTTIAHYFFRFPSPPPAPGVAIDTAFRGGITPTLFPVFGDKDPQVLAAGMFDANRLCQGFPSTTATYSIIRKFPEHDGGQYVFFQDQDTSITRAPISNHPVPVIFSNFKAVNIYKASFSHSCEITTRLFNYQGPSVNVRLWAHVTTRLRREPRLDIERGTAFAQHYDIGNHLILRFPDGKQTKFYDSVTDFGVDRPLSLDAGWHHSSERYDKSCSGAFKIDFALSPGEYTLVLNDVAWFVEADRRYEGWQASTLNFTLRAMSLEMLYPST